MIFMCDINKAIFNEYSFGVFDQNIHNKNIEIFNIGDKNYVGTTNILTQLIPIIRESNPIVADQMQRAIYERGKGVGTKR